MSDHAKLFKTGGSQAVRLPKAYRFEGQDEVRIHREGRRVVLEPVEPTWSQGFRELAGSMPDFEAPDEAGPADAPPDLDR